MRSPAVCFAVVVGLAACVPSDDARVDDFGRVIRSTSAEFCIEPEGPLRDEADPSLCGDQPDSMWAGFEVGQCVHLFVVNPNPYGEVDDVRPSDRCE